MAVIVGVTIPASLLVAALAGWVGLVIVGVVLILMWRLSPGLWRIFGIGLLGGAIAGVLILGPGFRLAMRVVAIVDVRRVEFSVAGTMFIIVLLGVIVGGIGGVFSAMLRKGLGWSSLVMSLLMTVVLVALLVIDTGLRDELVTLGAGPWLNIPMFAAVCFGYSLFANRLIDRFERKKSRPAAREPVEVPT
ncbi:MAG TPA: hypothetical protein VI193_12560 [Acidimicrobiia bacterium]